jgi:GTP-binding protein
MNLNKVTYIKSIVSLKNRPYPILPEIVIVGRSNVGKSSLINTIFNQKRLAKISSTPGKTRVINYFLVDDLLYFVDLPGYGYANISKSQFKEWGNIIERFLKYNRNIKLVLLLIDCRHNLMETDKLMIDWLRSYHIPFIIIMTKKDKLSNNQFNNQYNNLLHSLPDIEIIPFSARTSEGREDIISIIKGNID